MKRQPLQPRRLWLEELENRLVPSTVTSTVSTNWSGYAVPTSANQVTAVSGTWTVPKVTTSGYSATWVGIDGYSSSTVEQIGTESDLINGQTQYSAWFEMYPSGSVTIGSVTPGDTITASVTYGTSSKGAGQFVLTITDSSWSKPYTVTESAKGAQRSSAEWIEEAPSSGFGILQLANFGSVSFSNASATIGGTAGAINASTNTVEQINMVGSYGKGTLDSTSSLTTDGTGFTVTYTGTTTTPTPPPPQQHHHHGWETNQPTTPSTTTTTQVSNNNLVLSWAVFGTTNPTVNEPLSSPAAFNAAPIAGQSSTTPAFSLPTTTASLTSGVAHLTTAAEGETSPVPPLNLAPSGLDRLPAEPVPDEIPMPEGVFLAANNGLWNTEQNPPVFGNAANEVVISNINWDPAALQEISPSASENDGHGTNLLMDGAGVLLAMTLGGSWGGLAGESRKRAKPQ